MVRSLNSQKLGYLNHKVVYVIGEGDEKHRAVIMALAESGSDIVIGAYTSVEEVKLHSIANEVWAIGRRAIVVPLEDDDEDTLAWAVTGITSEFGHTDLVIRCEPVPEVEKDPIELEKASFGGVDID